MSFVHFEWNFGVYYSINVRGLGDEAVAKPGSFALRYLRPELAVRRGHGVWGVGVCRCPRTTSEIVMDSVAPHSQKRQVDGTL